MKIIIITDAWHPQVNGVVRTYQYLAEQLERLGHSVKVVSPTDFPVRIPMPAYPEIKLAVAPYPRLKRMIEAFQPDIIHIPTEGPLGWAGRKYCLKHGRHYSTSYHTHFPDYIAKRLCRFTPFLYKPIRNIARRVIKHFHTPASRMMIATQSLEDELRTLGFTNPMHRVSRGIKLDQFFQGENTVFKHLKAPIALYVGRVAIEKNLEDFLGMDWHGSKVIVGDGPSRKALEKQYPDAVFVGVKEGEELGAHYRSADIFVFPSRTDTFGIVLIEALASGLPIAAYNVTGPRDIVTKPFLGVLTEDNLALAAQQALHCGSKAQISDYAHEYYTWEHAGKQFEEGLIKASRGDA
ncbi:MAG: glycosyltransferase family 4 protein [Alphaproteobacteria bacterium]